MNKILRCRVGSMIYLFEPGGKLKYDKPYKALGFAEALQENYTVVAGSVARYSLLTLRETGRIVLEAVSDEGIYFPTAYSAMTLRWTSPKTNAYRWMTKRLKRTPTHTECDFADMM